VKKIYFSYIVQKNFSGQSRATEQIIESLDKSVYRPVILNQYSFDRKKGSFIAFINWIYNTLSISPTLMKIMLESKPVIHLSLGQEWASLIRILWWYFPLCVFKNINLIISLNGRNFQSWGKNERIAKVFVWILSKAKLVTVVGPNQKSILVERYHVQLEKVQIIPNTSDFHGISKDQLDKKFEDPSHIQIMFLSLLIESKGFKLFLDALLKIAREKRINHPIRVFLCGTISFTKYCSFFKNSEEEVEKYIEHTIKEIEKVSNERNQDFQLTWINGIRGIEKQTIFENTHLFVLPTFFPTESQPLVLMEAMSAGCAIITTKVGEIEYVVGNSGNYLEEPSVDDLTDKIFDLIHNQQILKGQAIEHINNFNANFSIDVYKSKWQKIIKSI
jgi:glycosyltransferase involved in cell wall biosynthesis